MVAIQYGINIMITRIKNLSKKVFKQKQNL
jgi:hypothetical protein